MTTSVAQKEFQEISRRIYMWDDPVPVPPTPYQHALLRRQSVLFNYLYNKKGEPPAGWSAPPCDVAETPENWFRNHFPKLWKEKMAAAGGKIPDGAV